MAELKALICKRCGGALDRVTLKCPYCGTYHKWNPDYGMLKATRIVVDRPGIEVLQKKIAISNDALLAMPQGEAVDYAQRSICESISESLNPYIEFYSERDIVTLDTIVMGRLRVVKPDYRF